MPKSAWHYNAAVDAHPSDLAVALSKRGVLFTATGDSDRANQDFLAAIELESAVTSVEKDLRRLGQLTTY